MASWGGGPHALGCSSPFPSTGGVWAPACLGWGCRHSPRRSPRCGWGRFAGMQQQQAATEAAPSCPGNSGCLRLPQLGPPRHTRAPWPSSTRTGDGSWAGCCAAGTGPRQSRWAMAPGASCSAIAGATRCAREFGSTSSVQSQSAAGAKYPAGSRERDPESRGLGIALLLSCSLCTDLYLQRRATNILR